MKRFEFFVKSPLFIVSAIALMAIVFVRCTKQGVTAAALDRTVAATALDSTVFSPFYDSTVIPYANSPAGINDITVTTGVLNIVKANCSSANCHGGNIQPTLTSYASIKDLVVPGNAEQSKLWQLLTTNDLNKAMPPVNTGNELSLTNKNVIYNWIMNGAKETPDLTDYRPAAIRLITSGCTSANCHSMPSVVGNWAKSGLLGAVASSDTATLVYKTPTGSTSSYVEMVNPTLLASVWQGYEDSCYQYYASIADITASSTAIGNTSFKPAKTTLSPHGPLSTYSAIILDMTIPKGIRTGSTTDYLTGGGSSSLLGEIDSSLMVRTPRASASGSAFSAARGGMASGDGGFNNSDVALIKAWFFLDPNIPDVWKFGIGNAGIFQYKTATAPITK
jgi:hypothetical protein